MMVQLSITSYGYHLVAQEEVDNRKSSITDVNKTESARRSRPSRPAEKEITEGLGKQAGDEEESYYKEEKWRAPQRLSQSRTGNETNGP